MVVVEEPAVKRGRAFSARAVSRAPSLRVASAPATFICSLYSSRIRAVQCAGKGRPRASRSVAPARPTQSLTRVTPPPSRTSPRRPSPGTSPGDAAPARERDALGVHGLDNEPLTVRLEQEGVADLREAAQRPQGVALPRLARFPFRLDLDALEPLDPAAGAERRPLAPPVRPSSTASPPSTAATQKSRYAQSVHTVPTRTGSTSPRGRRGRSRASGRSRGRCRGPSASRPCAEKSLP
jgi:hypothetical protein